MKDEHVIHQWQSYNIQIYIIIRFLSVKCNIFVGKVHGLNDNESLEKTREKNGLDNKEVDGRVVQEVLSKKT